MQSEQEFAQAAVGRLGRQNGHRIYDDGRVDPGALGIDLDRAERRATPTLPEPM